MGDRSWVIPLKMPDSPPNGNRPNAVLRINALKHAFPEQKHGTITVDYHSDGQRWTLSVNDDGIGMPKGADKAKPGLGSGIVEALARQLGGHIRVADTSPGTAVTL